MTRKKKKSNIGKPIAVSSSKAMSAAEETLKYWNTENMREAKPISIETDRPAERTDEPREK